MEKNKFDSIMGFLLGSIILVPFKIKPVLIVLFCVMRCTFLSKEKNGFQLNL